MTQIPEIVEHIDRLVSTLQAEHKFIEFYSNALSQNLNNKDRIAWNLVHMNASLVAFVTDLERLAAALTKGTNASTKV